MISNHPVNEPDFTADCIDGFCGVVNTLLIPTESYETASLKLSARHVELIENGNFDRNIEHIEYDQG